MARLELLSLTLKREKTWAGQDGDRDKHNKWWSVTLRVDGRLVRAEVHAQSDDGSIASNRGKWYASFKAVKCGRQRTGLDVGCDTCPKCAEQLAEPLAQLIFPRLGVPVASWDSPGNWWLFDVQWAKNLTDLEQTGRYRRAGPEVAVIELVKTCSCPFHGRVKVYDQDVMD